MDKQTPYILTIMLLGLTGIVACSVDSSAARSTSDGATVAYLIETPDSSLNMPAAISTQDLHPQSSPIPILSSTPAVEEGDARICQEPPQRFSFHDVLGIQRLAELRFASEELVTFEGWTQRPEPLVLPLTPEPTPDMRPDPASSSRILLAGGQIDLSNEELSSRPLDVNAPLVNPCNEACPFEVIGQSPNGKWQLIQVSDWLRAQMGLWLVNKDTTVRLIPYVPASPKWQWAIDNSLLWLSYSDHEQGGYTLVTHLDDPPVIKTATYGSVLDPYFYFLAYSPMDNTARAVPSFELGDERTEEVFTIALTDDLEKVNATQSVPGIVSVSWNEATQSFMAQVVTDDGITFQELSGSLSLNIPRSTLEALFPSFTGTINALPYGISAEGESAISKSGAKLALVHSPGEIWVFDCVASP